jgi:DNA-binding winged helix-turn-helix (wHTH) protein/TolB-like protein
MPSTLTELKNGFELGPWTVIPDRGLLRQGQTDVRIEPMVMDVLVVLANYQGNVVTRDQLVDEVWGGRFVTDEAIVAKIATLRQKLGDDSKNPKYIETIPRRGYRLIEKVKIPDKTDSHRRRKTDSRKKWYLVGAALAAIAFVVYIIWPSDPVNRIAVLNFTNISDDKDTYQYIVDGFREELVISLSSVPDLEITRGPELTDERTPKEISDELDVNLLVSGTLRTDGDKIRITVNLISNDGFQTWTDRIDGDADNIFGLQEIVATMVRDQILGEKGEIIRADSRPENFEAFDNYLLGGFFLGKRNLESLKHAEGLFEDTILIDPNFGRAYLRLAVTKLLLSDYQIDRRREIFQEAIEIANRGIDLDPSIRSAAGMIYGFVDHQFGRWTEADAAFESAFRATTVYPTAYQWHSRLLGALGLLDRALDQAIKARAMEPHSQVLNSRVAIAYFWINDMENARKYFRIANNMGVGAPIHHFAHTMFLIRDNRLEEARETVKYALAHLPGAGDWWVDPVFDGLIDPDDESTREAAYQTIRRMVVERLPPYITMISWSLFGESDEVMRIAMQVADSGTLYAHESAQVEIFYLDELKPLREHRDFLVLLQKLGLTNYWATIGCTWRDDKVVC